MIRNIYSVYDSKLITFMQPFVADNDQAAISIFTSAVSEPGTEPFNYPADYSLFRVGQFNDETGHIEKTQHENLGIASQFQRKG